MKRWTDNVLREKGIYRVVGSNVDGNSEYVENIEIQILYEGEWKTLESTGLANGYNWGLDTRTVWIVDSREAFDNTMDAARALMKKRHEFAQRLFAR